ncbi:riboflavin biosynthesis protein RibF [Candidatus Enterococcus mansonii]|uniref:Riboflavin biosynthesis protein n=1 Tax=Candidatus Enterococcus mansonii TaxID=1834181 RepID=A0A242CIX2_9ENTE|nr:riboflavin biosynthesis protein RibF [Enterococcus sp. 4G2_DIV0659]OTO10197.1 riboflavin biosynthesis protein RibF [Enterococcus sp. 4G2_DIV0659]
MQVIPIRHPYSAEQIPTDEVVMVLGFFDGVHKGHQKVIETGKKIAEKKGVKLAVMTFNQHPSIVFQKVLPEHMKYLNSLEQKEQLMEKQGVDILYVIEFTSAFAHLAPQEFVDQYIVGLNAVAAVSGFDYTYGPKEVADVAHLPGYANNRFEVITVNKEELDGEKISSTRIRELMEHGRMGEVTELLGYVYETEGTVVHGDARGRLLGFPTANIKVKSTVRLPRIGVYAVKIQVGNTWYVGMGSIGHNDTFGDGRELTVEVYILNFHQDIYGEQVTVRWNHYLRDQVKFDGADNLIIQLKQDEVDTAAYFWESED